MNRFLLSLLVLGTMALCAEEHPFLFITLEAQGEQITLLSADTVMGSDRPLRRARLSPLSFSLLGSGGSALASGEIPAPPDQKGDVASPDGTLTPVELPSVTWSFRIPLEESATLLRLYRTEPLSGQAAAGVAGSRGSTRQEILSFELQKRNAP